MSLFLFFGGGGGETRLRIIGSIKAVGIR